MLKLVILALLLIGPIGTVWMPSMLGALFLLSTPLQMLWVTVASLLVAAMARVAGAPGRLQEADLKASC